MSLNDAYLVAGIVLALFAVGGGLVAVIRGAIRFAQYMVRSEEAQARSADTLDEIKTSLADFKTETEKHLREHDETLAVVTWELERSNGRPISRNHPALPRD